MELKESNRQIAPSFKIIPWMRSYGPNFFPCDSGVIGSIQALVSNESTLAVSSHTEIECVAGRTGLNSSVKESKRDEGLIDRDCWSARRIIPAVCAILIGVCLLPISDALWRVSFDLLNSLKVLQDFFSISQYCVSATAFLAVIAALWKLDRPRRKLIPLFLIAYLLSTGVSTSAKVLFGRARPAYSVAVRSEQRRWIDRYLREHPDAPLKDDGSVRWLLFKSNRPFNDSNFSSFPSGHATSAFVMAAFLAALYPRARFIWVIVAFGCSLSRVYFKHHFLEDVLVGGGVGWIVGNWVYSRPWLIGSMDKLQEIPRLGAFFRSPSEWQEREKQS